ncbi:hypothetical protein LPJ66_005503 [Kickxella alabastrina]|uniref:Uncharacterized protein n=1 Tax=Kickxella alabastrina TaxID=61397 RepID=A0ACC1IIA6_9FUNG|nr:hypothetical protein LPJ66_005503 [Kickxella alabastrina]
MQAPATKNPLSPARWPKRKSAAKQHSQQRQSIEPDVAADNDLPSLLDIFQFLDSPDPSLYINVCLSSEYADIFQACIGASIYDGMRTLLYRYQKNSVFKMLRRELLPDFILDPNYAPLTENENIETKRFCHPLLPFFQFAHGFDQATNRWSYTHQQSPNTPVPAQDVAWYSDARGGIICEDMGTGKTCECLALILLTKRQMARPPIEGETLPCVGTVTSRLETDAGKNTSDNNSGVGLPRKGVPSLKYLAVRTALLSCAESLRVMHDDGMIPDDLWQQLEPYPPYYWVNPIAESRTRRGAPTDNMQSLFFKVYLSSSTIVVVPDNLVDQWVREKYKHVEDHGGLEILKLDDSVNTIPEPQTLIKYDLVLVSVSRLSKEYNPIDSNLAELWNMCRCYSRGLSRCTCDRRAHSALNRSPLLRVHWKRIIVDEGHIMSSRNTTRSLMAAYLIAERRWVCTGTPTHNLVHATSALTVDKQSTRPPLSLPPTLAAAADADADANTDTDANPEFAFQTSSECSDSPPNSSTNARARKMPRRHLVDPRESSSDFLQLGTLVSKFLRVGPFAHSTSTWTNLMVLPYKQNKPGAFDRLQALMQNIMVRNRPDAITSDVQLPPLHEKIIQLSPTRHQALTYNIVVAFFNINAVLTERVGRDYFFHPENKRHLRQIVENLFHACFWFSINPKHIADGVMNGKQALELWERGEKPYSVEDVDLLRRSIAELQRASSDSEWAYVAHAESVGYWISGLPHKISEHLFNAPTDTAECQNSESARLATASQLLQMVAAAKDMLATASDGLPPLSTNIDPSEFEELQSAKMSGCTSNKIAYILDQIRLFYQDEKCIVFANTQNEVALLHEALDVARIPHLVYANQAMSQSQRRHNITTFSTSTFYNVILVDVYLAAYGIDLSAASRVWFVSPIWQAARERQAIKRAHRLGQSRPVFVETLLTRKTIEEALWRRRQEISRNDSEMVAKDVEEDGKMRGMLSDSKFIEVDESTDANSVVGVFGSDIRFWPANIRYPRQLRQKYKMWSPGSPENVSPSVPFFKTRRLTLRLTEGSEETGDF